MAKKRGPRGRPAGPSQRGAPAQPQTAWPFLPMSEVLLDLIDPLTVGLPDPPDPDTAAKLVLFGALAWNVSRIDDAAERREEIRRLVEEAAASRDIETAIGDDLPKLIEILDVLAERARELWPESRQEVLDVRVFENESGELRVRAFWRLPGDENAGAGEPRAAPRPRRTRRSKKKS